tara:strand:+ start:1551 stop:2990 length:1440 start_codon:yes stop_codon:yes gene_type:complete
MRTKYFNKNSAINVENLKKDIDDIVKSQKFISFTKQCSNALSLPKGIIKKKIKLLLSNKFDYKTFSFTKSNLLLSFYYSTTILIKLIALIILSKIYIFKLHKKKVDVIIENIENEDSFNYFAKLAKSKKKIFVITKSKLLSLKNYKIDSVHNIFIPFKKNSIPNTRLLLNIIFKNYFKDINNDFSLNEYLLSILFAYLKNISKFNYISSKYLLFTKIYWSCPIQNFLFKKNGGKRIITTQTHVPEHSISLFKDLDTLCSWGTAKDVKTKLETLGGKVNQVIPIGSLKMEFELAKKNNINKMPRIDVLIIGVNLSNYIRTSRDIKKNYYLFLEWMKSLSLKYKKLNFVYKHHTSFAGKERDVLEDEIIKDSRIKRIVLDKQFNSYDYLKKSRIAFSFCSSMVLESVALGKHCFFVDPNNASQTFFKNLNYMNCLKINNKNKLEKMISNHLKMKKVIRSGKRKLYCHPPKNTTNRLVKILN